MVQRYAQGVNIHLVVHVFGADDLLGTHISHTAHFAAGLGFYQAVLGLGYAKVHQFYLPLWGLPVFGKEKVGWLDVAVYVAFTVGVVKRLASPSLGFPARGRFAARTPPNPYLPGIP